MLTPKTAADDHVLPRPVDRLPSYAQAPARRAAATKLEATFSLDPAAAGCIADAVVDPSELRRSIESPVRLAVPGGVVVAVRSEVWAHKAMPDPRNPRIGPSRRHPFAVAPGTDEESRFRPIPDPTSQGRSPWLEVGIESREHVTWASEQAKRYVLDANDWRLSIRNQGILTEVWLSATRYVHKDGSSDVWVPTTSEGSSRLTASHDIMELRSVDLAYDLTDRQMRAIVDKLNDAFDLGPSKTEMEALRCARVPALILVGYEPFPNGDEAFSGAVRSLVALRHVDAPKEWGEGPEMESLADAALEEMERKGLLTPAKRSWMAGAITRKEAADAHLSSDPAVRAAAIVEVFTSNDPAYRIAIRDAITTQSTRKRLSPLLRTRLATALIVRGIGGGAHIDRIRRYMQHGFGEAVRDGDWSATFRSPDDLLQAGLKEYEADPDEFGPDRLELAARGVYPLIANLRLHADRGTADNNQPDRRTPGQVIDAMLRQPAGLRQLHRALIDYPAGQPIRVVDENGNVVRTDDGAQERHVTDTSLRMAFPPAGSIKAPRSDRTASEKLQAALAQVSAVVNDLEKAQKAVEEVLGADGSPLVETEGVAKSHCDAWAVILKQMSDATVEWRATWRRRHRNAGSGADTQVEETWIEKTQALDSIVAEWDDEAEGDTLDEEQAS
jgi:hypothetical protein